MKSIVLWLSAVFLCFLYTSSVYARDNLRLPDIRALGTGGNGVTESAIFNPALTALCINRQAKTQYFNQYGLSELASVSAELLYPNAWLPVGIHLSSFGYDQYRETMGRISIAKQLDQHWSFGLGFQFSMLQTELLDERPVVLSTDIGMGFMPVDNLLIGLLIMNLPAVSVGDKDVDINGFADYSAHFGARWEFVNNLLIMGSGNYTETDGWGGSIGMEYRAFDRFFLRTGLDLSPLTPAIGVGCDIAFLQIDAVARSHPHLGISSGISLTFTF